MRIGFLTNCFRGQQLASVVEWAKQEGFEFLEIGAATPASEDEIRAAHDQVGVTAIIMCRNFLDPDPRQRSALMAQLEWRLDVASRLGIPFVTTSTGIDETKPLQWNVRAFATTFDPWLRRAQAAGVKICLENCPSTGNFAVSPYTWRLALEAVQSDALKLCFDPSHLVKLFIDVYKAAERFALHIGYVHVKDCAILDDALADKGIWHNNDYWQHRIPGDGVVDWRRLLSTLREAGFDGDLSIEHEDPRYESSIGQVKEALLRSRDVIAQALAE